MELGKACTPLKNSFLQNGRRGEREKERGRGGGREGGREGRLNGGKEREGRGDRIPSICQMVEVVRKGPS